MIKYIIGFSMFWMLVIICIRAVECHRRRKFCDRRFSDFPIDFPDRRRKRRST